MLLLIAFQTRSLTTSQLRVGVAVSTPIFFQPWLSCTTSAAVTITFVGIQPRVKQVPPKPVFSITATRLPAFNAASATKLAPPVPITITSYCFIYVILSKPMDNLYSLYIVYHTSTILDMRIFTIFHWQ